MSKPLCNSLNASHSSPSFAPKIYIFLSIVAVSMLYFSVVAKAQTISTAAGTVTWTLDGNTSIEEVELDENSGSHGDGFDNAMYINVTGTNITYSNTFHFSNTYGAVVQQVAITNSGGTPSTFTLTSTGNLGSDGSTTWHYASTSNFHYTISSDQSGSTDNGSDPVISFCYGDAALNAYTTSINYANGDDNASFIVSNVPIAAGATVRFLILAGIGNIDDDNSNQPDQALLAVQNLANSNNWPADFTSFLTGPQKAEIINWSSLITLPLTWQSFTSRLQNENVLLNWSTANEQNTRDFTVQHSVDGVNWTNIALLDAAGNSNTDRHYNFIHTAPVKGYNYYRLLQSDIDNRSNFSVVRIINVEKQDRAITVLRNPVTNGKLIILLNETQNLQLLGTAGNLLWQNKLAAGLQQVDVSHLPSGMYFLQSPTFVQQIVIDRRL